MAETNGNIIWKNAKFVQEFNNCDINKYLNDVVHDSNLDKYADLIIKYLEQFKLDLVSQVKNHKSIDKYIKSVEEKI